MRIYYVCPSSSSPVGGVKVIYDHVDALNRHGFDARVFHDEPGFRASWFSNTTSLAYPTRGATYDKGDYLVLPDFEGRRLFRAMPSSKKVMFHQGPLMTFGLEADADLRVRRRPYESPDVVASLVTSEYLAAFCKHAFPSKPTLRTLVGIDTDRFQPSKLPKKKQIAVMPRRHFQEASVVLQMLDERRARDRFEVVFIDEMHEEDVARTLSESWIYLALSPTEGFGLPAAEAMASGCLVVGYHGHGGKEFMDPRASYPVESGDLLGCAKTLEKVVRMIEATPEAAARVSRRARRVIAERYGRATSEASIVKAWKKILTLG